MQRSAYWVLMLVLLVFACQTTPEKKAYELFAEEAWDGFTAETSRITSVGWCVSGDFKGQAGAVLIVPEGRNYLVKRQYLDTKECQLNIPVIV